MRLGRKKPPRETCELLTPEGNDHPPLEVIQKNIARLEMVIYMMQTDDFPWEISQSEELYYTMKKQLIINKQLGDLLTLDNKLIGVVLVEALTKEADLLLRAIEMMKIGLGDKLNVN